MRSLSNWNQCWARVVWVASLWLALPCLDVCAQQPAAAVERTRVVLLKNDRCLTGIVRQLGDQVVVEFDLNSRISKAATEIQTIADDLEGIYQYKIGRYSQLGVGEHMRLARWCLSVGLHEHASKHFQLLNKTAGDHPLVKKLGVELREQLLKEPEFRDYLGLPPVAVSTIPVATIQTTSTNSQPTLPILPLVVSSFADHVQPILLNRCSQSGCHGFSATNKLKIIQPIGTARGRLTEQNCRSALQFVEVDESKMSGLLRHALSAHGVQKLPSISSQETQLIEYLQSWTTFARNPVMAAVDRSPSLRNLNGETKPAVFMDRTAEAISSSGPLPLGKNAGPLRTVPRQPKFGVQGISDQPHTSELDALDDQVRRALGEPPRDSSTATSDPFDPADFNRRAAVKANP